MMDFIRRQVQKRPWLLLAALAAAFAIGIQLGGLPHSGAADSHDHDQTEVWTCSMHPQIRQPESGLCPICNMELIPADQGSGDLKANQIEMSETSKQLARIRTAPVEQRFVDKRVRLKGQVEYDETQVESITAWVSGRIDRLYVDFVGIMVREGDHLAEMYSPEVLMAQHELAEAFEAWEQEFRPEAKKDAQEILEATKDKLRLWGLSEQIMERVMAGEDPQEQIEIDSPQGGVVIEKKVNSGEYVQVGQPLFSVADLSTVWVILEAYESDLPWLRYGQDVEIEIPALPGEEVHGRIALIDPVLDLATRTTRVRVNVLNSELKLKPGMFVRADVRSRMARNGRVIEPDLADKWISPMHPEIVSDEPGDCPICGMDLVRAAELGFVSGDSGGESPLVIPASAVLFTGKRSLVYVEVQGRDSPTYEGREVELGARAGDSYVVLDGLTAGEQVVVNGAFKIDSAMQLQARPSMMTPKEDPPGRLAAPAQFVRSLDALLEAYLEVQEALADNEDSKAASAAAAALQTFQAVDSAGLGDEAHGGWEIERPGLEKGLTELSQAQEIEARRQALYPVSTHLFKLIEVFGHTLEQPLFRAYCPMAFNNAGADWLQEGDLIDNPYFGPAMLTCGEIKQRYEANSAAPPTSSAAPGHRH